MSKTVQQETHFMFYPGNVVLTIVGCCCSCLYFMSFNLQRKQVDKVKASLHCFHGLFGYKKNSRYGKKGMKKKLNRVIFTVGYCIAVEMVAAAETGPWDILQCIL